MFKKTLFLSLIFLASGLIITACSLPLPKKAAPAVQAPETTNTTVTTTSAAITSDTNQLRKFNSYDELAAFLADNNNPVGGYTPATASPLVEKPNNSWNYSGFANRPTNVAVPDIVKVNGDYTYALVRNELFIIKSLPASGAQVVSKINFDYRPQGVIAGASSIVVFGADDSAASRSFRRRNPYTFFKVFDLSNPSDPKLVRDLSFEGSYSAVRLIGDFAYLLTSFSGSYIADEPLLPRVLDSGKALSSVCGGEAKCFAPEVLYFDSPYDIYNFTSLTAINLTDAGAALSGQVMLLNSGNKIYVSETGNIYITYTRDVSEYNLELAAKEEIVSSKLSAADQEQLKKIAATDNFVLNPNEKKIKAAQIIDRYLYSLGETERAPLTTEIDNLLLQKVVEKSKGQEKTIIHKFALTGGKAEYRAQGEVSGRLLNNLSIEENNGYLRLAASRHKDWALLADVESDSYTNIHVLDSDLRTLGSLENLATTQKIYAARFIGNRAYLTTYKAADPLFVINLSDPAKPAVLGAVQMPGKDNYLYPVDANGQQLLSLGRATDEAGTTVTGLKLSLFDFSDLSKPKELDSYLLGGAGSDSIAISDHDAFSYSVNDKTLIVPAAIVKDSRLSFSGVLAFSLNDNQLNLKGQVDHSAGGRTAQSDVWEGFNYYDNTVKRSFIINGGLYSFSNKFFRVSNLDGLTDIESLPLTATSEDIAAASGSTASAGGVITPAVETPAAALPTETASSTTPAVEQPTVPEPVVEQPVVEQPAVEQPVSPEPAIEQPAEPAI